MGRQMICWDKTCLMVDAILAVTLVGSELRFERCCQEDLVVNLWDDEVARREYARVKDFLVGPCPWSVLELRFDKGSQDPGSQHPTSNIQHPTSNPASDQVVAVGDETDTPVALDGRMP